MMGSFGGLGGRCRFVFDDVVLFLQVKLREIVTRKMMMAKKSKEGSFSH